MDLPIQRERATGYPLIQASGVKGALRSAMSTETPNGPETAAIFGPASIVSTETAYAGAVSFGDARLLLMPIRSLNGVYAWATSLDLLTRFARDIEALELSDWPGLPAPLTADDHAYTSGPTTVVDGLVVLEEFSFSVVPEPAPSATETGAEPEPQENEEGANSAPSNDDEAVEPYALEHAIVPKLARWLAGRAVPSTPVYDYWRSKMETSLVILPDNAMRDFALHATEVVTRIRIDTESKTVEDGALWTQELLPADTVLYSLVHAGRLRMSTGKPATLQNDDPATEAGKILTWLTDPANLKHQIQIGGDETVGRGFVRLSWQGAS